MSRRQWHRFQPNSLQSAIEGCIESARDRHNRSVDHVASDAGINSKFTLYKYIESASLPARLILPFQQACRADFVTTFLAHASGKLVIPLPTGRKLDQQSVVALQQACTTAVDQLLQFLSGKRESTEVIGSLTTAMEHLAFHRAEVERFDQPELALDGGMP